MKNGLAILFLQGLEISKISIGSDKKINVKGNFPWFYQPAVKLIGKTIAVAL